jgi:hypothetical protein
MLARVISTGTVLKRGWLHYMRHADLRCCCQHRASEMSTLAAIEQALGPMSTEAMVCCQTMNLIFVHVIATRLYGKVVLV